MKIGLLQVSLHVPQSASLKQKRRYVQSLKEQIRRKFNVSIAEVDSQNLWQRIDLAAPIVATDAVHIDRVFSEVMKVIARQSELEIIDQALKTVDLAEERYLQEKSARLSYEKETLKLARKLIEEENFEEALTKLETLSDAQKMTPEMKELKRVATEKLIKRERNKAAKYFLMARKTPDTAKKEELLLSSYDILKILIKQYPSSPMIEKLNDNLRTVREELTKLGKDPES